MVGSLISIISTIFCLLYRHILYVFLIFVLENTKIKKAVFDFFDVQIRLSHITLLNTY